MPRCRRCNLTVSGVAENCPRCGMPLPSRFGASGRWILLIVALVFVVFAFVALRSGGSGERAQPQALPATVQQPFVVTIETSISGDARPTVTGTTNLPDGTELWLWLLKPWLPDGKQRLAAGLPACGDGDCFPLQTNATLPNGQSRGVVVKNGQFEDGPFTNNNGAALRPGKYVLEVSAYFASLQPPGVRAVIGLLGENMTGPLVNGCCFSSHQDHAEIQKQIGKIREAAPTIGNLVYYARYVEIGQPRQPNAQTSSPLLATEARVAKCQTMRRNVQDWTPAEQQAYRQGCWQRAEADNGAVYLIDLGLIQSFAAGASTAIYTDEGGAFNPMNLKRWYFTCEGHFSMMEDSLSPSMYAPPRSVARHISDVVCAGAGVKPR
jgi:hypothetical protein